MLKFAAPLLTAGLLAFLSGAASGQPGGVPPDFQITKITRDFTETPVFTRIGGPQFDLNRDARWLQVEVEFSSAPEFVDELTLRYYILMNGRLLTGEVTHVNIVAGREHRSVMYVPPRVIARVTGNRPPTESAVANIAVEIIHNGRVQMQASFARAEAQWFAPLPKFTGMVLNKNETPFAPLYWDRYEQIKSLAR